MIQTNDEQNDLLQIVNDLTLGNYSNENGGLLADPAFGRLVHLASKQAGHLKGNEQDVEFDMQPKADEPFHIEADVYDSGDYASLLVVPANGTYVVVANNEHLATLSKTCEDPTCWAQQDGTLDDDLVEKLGEAIDSYTQSL